MKIFYTTSISFPSSYVNRLQTLHTAQALYSEVGEGFILGVNSVQADNGIYKGTTVNFMTSKSILVAWRTLRYVKLNNVNNIYCREPSILLNIILINKFYFRIPLKYFFEAHAIPFDFRQNFVIKNSHHVFCISEGLIKDLDYIFPNISKSLLRNGVDLSTFNNYTKESGKTFRTELNIPDNKFIVSYIGGVQTFGWKGDDIFALARKYVDNKDIHFVIAGAKNSELNKIKNEMGTKNTTILGRLSQKEVMQLEIASDVLVLPNKSGEIESEKYTSPIKMFSYMRSGTPIIASSLSSIKEVLDDNSAYFFEPDNPKALAKMIVYLHGHYEESLQKAARAKSLVEQFSWEVKAKKIINQITKI